MSYLKTTDGTRLRIFEQGTGPTIVLIHGWKMSHRCWDRAIARLSKTHRVIAYDLRGMGESDKPRSEYDFDEHASDLNDVLSALDAKDAVLVGWSMGCSVSLSYLQAYQQRAAGLVLLNGPIKLIATDDFPYGVQADVYDAIYQDILDHWPEREREFVARYLAEPHPEHVDWFTRIALQTPLDVVLRVVDHQTRLDFREYLKELTIPVMAMYGRLDPYYPSDIAGWIADRTPKGEQYIFEKSAHCPPVEQAAEFAEVLTQFVARCG
jgi:non-heme chloroperoxidase